MEQNHTETMNQSDNTIINNSNNQNNASNLNTQSGNSRESISNFQKLFESSWDLYKKASNTVFSVLLVGTLISMFMFLVFVVTLIGALSFATIVTSWTGFFSVMIFGIVACLVFVCALYMCFLTMIALYQALGNYTEKISMRERFRNARGKIHDTISISLLGFILVIGGLLLFLIPGIWAMIVVNFFAFPVIFENRRSKDAMNRVLNVMRGHWWNVFGMLILFELLIILVTIPINFVGRTLGVTEIISPLFSIVIMPLAIIFKYEIWKDLVKIHKEEDRPMSVYVKAFMIIGTAVVCGIVLAFVLKSFQLK